MMSQQQIIDLSDEAAERAAQEGLTPYVPWDANEVNAYGVSRNVPFPNLGSHRPQGWTLAEHRMVDSSGFGSESEPALTLAGMKRWVIENMGHSNGYAIIEEGQFQIVIGRFEKVAR